MILAYTVPVTLFTYINGRPYFYSSVENKLSDEGDFSGDFGDY